MKTQPVIERRFHRGAIEIRSSDDGAKKTIRGYAAVFGVMSENLGDDKYRFFETIERGAFDNVLKDDVRALFNHDANLILARSKNGEGTLKIGADDVGLWYELEPDQEQSYARDLMRALSRGDVDQSSFAFSLSKDGQVWESKDENGVSTVKRTIRSVSRLYDVSPVTYPAYPDATVALRTFDEFARSAQEQPKHEPQIFPERSLWAARFGLR